MLLSEIENNITQSPFLISLFIVNTISKIQYHFILPRLMSSIRPHFSPTPREMRPPNWFLTRQQELDAEVEEDQHFDVDDEGYEGVSQTPVHGTDSKLSVLLRRTRAVFSAFCVVGES